MRTQTFCYLALFLIIEGPGRIHCERRIGSEGRTTGYREWGGSFIQQRDEAPLSPFRKSSEQHSEAQSCQLNNEARALLVSEFSLNGSQFVRAQSWHSLIMATVSDFIPGRMSRKLCLVPHFDSLRPPCQSRYRDGRSMDVR